ncbi:unnamed protein product [Caenorhabditis nigoni]|uniref:Protein kinase domain-containing protein n=1 Tax=Caenorhabditis nigoni TaxID=1611254 RepID=A0A2G5UT43_9PELO|nr:hypothetical protein B9Z55_009693 [Caenorhabditis nigoni]
MADTTIIPSSSSLSPNTAFSQIIQHRSQSSFTEEPEGVPNLSPSGYECIRYMGACNGGQIYLGKRISLHSMERNFVAIKKYNIDDIDDYAAIAKETAYLRLLQHPNIVELTASFVYEKSIYQMTPAMNLGSLFDIVFEYKKWGLNEKAIAGVTIQVLEGLHYLHERRYIHRDVKPRHILLDSAGNVKLTGFRYMVELNHHLDCAFEYDTHLQNQMYYLAPEVVAQNMHGYTSKSDIYMLGISVCEAINGVMPFGELEPLEMLFRKVNGQVPRPVDKKSLEDDADMGIDISMRPADHLTRVFSQEMHQFISNCLNYHPEMRGTASELKASPWLGSEEMKKIGPHQVQQELGLDYSHFDLGLWSQEPLLPAEPEQKYEIAFDYSPIS